MSERRPFPEGIRIAPSILSADFSRFGEQVDEVMAAGARIIHVDVMDGHFVPPITMGPPVVAALRDRVHDAGGFLDVHLMIDRPERHVEAFAAAGADNITIHQEATPHVHYALQQIAEHGANAGLAITPATPVEMVVDVLDLLDVVLCMTVNPGWGGQRFIPHSLNKVGRLRSILPSGVRLEVDGGIDTATAPGVVARGANLLVAGSHVFGAPHPGDAYRGLVEAAGAQ